MTTPVLHRTRLGVSYTAARLVATTSRRDRGGPDRWLSRTRLPPGFTVRAGAVSSSRELAVVVPFEIVLDRDSGAVTVFSGEAVIEMGSDGCAFLSLDGAVPAEVRGSGLDEGLALLAVEDAFSQAAVLLEREARSFDALIGVPV